MTGFSTSLDIEEVLSRARDDKLHVTVADVVKSFDTVDRSILELWTWHAGFASMVSACLFFSFRARCALGFGLAAGLGALWCRDGGILQGCPLSITFLGVGVLQALLGLGRTQRGQNQVEFLLLAGSL